jgi:hypothetical protein
MMFRNPFVESERGGTIFKHGRSVNPMVGTVTRAVNAGARGNRTVF